MSAETSSELGAAVRAERVEERLDALAVAAGRGPHQPAGVVVDDDGQIALPLAVADLVDPDPTQPGEQVAPPGRLGRDTFTDRTDRAPRDPQQLGDGLARALHRQPRRLVLEGPGKARPVARPRHRADDHTMLTAAHPRRLRLDIGQRRAKVKRPPAPPPLTEIEA